MDRSSPRGADPAPRVVLRLDADAVRRLAAYLTAVRDHLRLGAPMPPYKAWAFDFRDRRIPGVMWDIRDQFGLPQMHRMGPPNPYRDAMGEPTARTLRLDAATARDLDGALYAVGEHYAAGAAIGPAGDDQLVRLETALAEVVDGEPATE